MPSPLLPPQLENVAYFASRQVYVRVGEDVRQYRHAPEESDTPLETQVNEWIEKTRNRIVSVSAPNITAYREEDREIRFFTTAVVFLTPIANG